MLFQTHHTVHSRRETLQMISFRGLALRNLYSTTRLDLAESPRRNGATTSLSWLLRKSWQPYENFHLIDPVVSTLRLPESSKYGDRL
jgi:hypothetical protein